MSRLTKARRPSVSVSKPMPSSASPMTRAETLAFVSTQASAAAVAR
jgi:hypothetical protein